MPTPKRVDCSRARIVRATVGHSPAHRRAFPTTTCLKHEGFQEEREWRVVHCPDFDVKSKLITSSVEPISGIPQLVYKLPLDKSIDPILEDIDFSNIFDRLIIGPSQFSIAMSAAFVNVLSQIGVPEASKKVFASHIPIRS
jgi:hypothetical protein